MLESSIFILTKCTTTSNQVYYHFLMKQYTIVNQTDVDLLTQSLKCICNDTISKNNIIFDCSQLKSASAMKTFCSLNLKDALSLKNEGLSKFIIVSSSQFLKLFATPIIHLKKASHYTFITETLASAELLLAI